MAKAVQRVSANVDIQIELWPVDRLKPYEGNARTHSNGQINQIAASITEFGWTNPALVDGDDGILAGHARILATKKLGLSASRQTLRPIAFFPGQGVKLQAETVILLG